MRLWTIIPVWLAVGLAWALPQQWPPHNPSLLATAKTAVRALTASSKQSSATNSPPQRQPSRDVAGGTALKAETLSAPPTAEPAPQASTKRSRRSRKRKRKSSSQAPSTSGSPSTKRPRRRRKSKTSTAEPGSGSSTIDGSTTKRPRRRRRKKNKSSTENPNGVAPDTSTRRPRRKKSRSSSRTTPGPDSTTENTAKTGSTTKRPRRRKSKPTPAANVTNASSTGEPRLRTSSSATEAPSTRAHTTEMPQSTKGVVINRSPAAGTASKTISVTTKPSLTTTARSRGGAKQASSPRVALRTPAWAKADLGLYYSFTDPYLHNLTFSNQESQYVCTMRSMRLVSLNTRDKSMQVANMMAHYDVAGVWTSGSRSQFEFYWGTGQPVSFGYRSWSSAGVNGYGQPDNAGSNEDCLAVLNNAFGNDGVTWHDVACHRKMAFVCEPAGFQF